MNITDEDLETLKGIKDGKAWQYRRLSTLPTKKWKNGAGTPYQYLANGWLIRLKPESRMIPFSFEDIKPNMVFRKKGAETWRFPQLVAKTAIYFGVSSGNVTWENLQNYWEWSSDAENWRTCEKRIDVDEEN